MRPHGAASNAIGPFRPAIEQPVADVLGGLGLAERVEV